MERCRVAVAVSLSIRTGHHNTHSACGSRGTMRLLWKILRNGPVAVWIARVFCDGRSQAETVCREWLRALRMRCLHSVDSNKKTLLRMVMMVKHHSRSAISYNQNSAAEVESIGEMERRHEHVDVPGLERHHLVLLGTLLGSSELQSK